MRRFAKPALGAAVFAVLGAVSLLALRGYFTPEAMVYLLTFRWCT